MKFNVEKKLLVDELKKANKIINKLNPNVSLRNVLLEIENKKMKMITSDGTMTYVSHVDLLDSEKDYKILLNCQLLVDSISKINTESINFEVKGNEFIIKGGKRKFKLNVMDIETYPKFKDENTENIAILKAKDFTKMANSTSKMASRKDTRPILTGINAVGIKGSKSIQFVSTDGYRLAKINIETINELKNDINVTIPYQFIEYVSQIIESDETPIELSFGEREARIRHQISIIKSRLIEGGFPNTQRLIIGERKNNVKIDRKYLEDMIDCSIFKDDKNYIVTMDIKSNVMTISNHNNELGGFKEAYEIEYDGNDLIVSVNVDYFKQALKTFDSEYVEMEFEDKPLRPFTIVSVDGEYDLLQLLLPVRTY